MEATSNHRVIERIGDGHAELDVTVLQSHEFIVGIAVAATAVSALTASSLLRSVALALAVGGVVLLDLQGGAAALMALSSMLEGEIRALPNFSHGMMVGLAISAIMLVGLPKRAA